MESNFAVDASQSGCYTRRIMSQNSPVYSRHSIRLQNYDYSQSGAYFITICTHKRLSLFGEIVDDEMCLNEYGQIVLDEWLCTASIRKEMNIDEFVVMPNHIHGIVWITGKNTFCHKCRGAQPCASTTYA